MANFGVEFPILYTSRDPDVPLSFGVFNLFGDSLASASVFLITDGNRIAWKDVGTNYQHQVSADVIIDRLNMLTAS